MTGNWNVVSPLRVPVAFLAAVGLFLPTAIKGQETKAGDERPAWSIEYDTVERRAIERQMEKDLNRLSIGDVSRFHRDLVETLGPVLPHHIDVAYNGPLRIEGAHPSLKIHNQGFTQALCWSVEGSLVVFSFWISTARTESTVAMTQAGKQTIYLNVDHVHQNQPTTKPLEDLGGKSVKEILKLMEKPREPSNAASDPSDNPPAIAEKRFADVRDYNELIDLIQRETERPFLPASGSDFDIVK